MVGVLSSSLPRPRTPIIDFTFVKWFLFLGSVPFKEAAKEPYFCKPKGEVVAQAIRSTVTREAI